MSDITIQESADGPPYVQPRFPFYVDEDYDICDAEGWLVCRPAYSVWPDDRTHALTLCAALNAQRLPRESS